jgi:hypothetical protein
MLDISLPFSSTLMETHRNDTAEPKCDGQSQASNETKTRRENCAILYVCLMQCRYIEQTAFRMRQGAMCPSLSLVGILVFDCLRQSMPDISCGIERIRRHQLLRINHIVGKSSRARIEAYKIQSSRYVTASFQFKPCRRHTHQKLHCKLLY